MSLSRFLTGFLVALLIVTASVHIVITSTPALLFITTYQTHFVVNNSSAQLVVAAIPNHVGVVAPVSTNGNARSFNSEGKLIRSTLTDLPISIVLTPSTLSGRHSSRFMPGALQQRNLHRLWFTSTSPTGRGGLFLSLFSGVSIRPPPDALVLSPNDDSSAFSLIRLVVCLVRCILVIPCWSRHGNVVVRSVRLSSMSTPPQKFNSFRVSMKVKMSPLSDCSTGMTRVHLAQSSDVVLKLRTLLVQPSQVSEVCRSSVLVSSTIRFHGPYILFISAKSRIFILFVSVEIHLVSSESLVEDRAGLARSSSFQTLRFGLFNVDFDYSVLVVVTYLEMHLMILHGSPVVEQVNLLPFVMLFCFCIMLLIKPSRISPVIILLPLSIAPDVIA